MLPKVKAVVYVYNPKFVPGPNGSEPFQVLEEREVEVLTLNLNSRGMRVRFPDVDHNGKVKTVTTDIGLEWFYAKYDIVEKA